jgi:hypothetical protein
VSAITLNALEEIAGLPLGEQAEPLAGLVPGLDDEDLADGELREKLAAVLLALVESGAGAPASRVIVGEALGRLGDPRLRTPADAGYWTTAPLLDGSELEVGRFPVTHAEFRAFAEGGGYEAREHWTEEGLAWLASGEKPWPEVVFEKLKPAFLVDNQPVVGVTWFEAVAYAAAHGARLLTFQERMGVVRGPGKRPYPWGEPFGHGNANTREEALSRPCAVGLFRRDCTPEGVFDLAGNVAEWVVDEVDGQRVIAPGAWSQESLSSWAKARLLQPPDCRGADLGLRLARSVG